MDIIILGLLMMKPSTIYEMRKAIETNLTNISSSSVGSIQAAIKKLLDKNLIQFNEYVENSVNKKVYSITEEGKSYFQESISQPMTYKEKSMELGKFLFMGFVDKNKRLSLLETYIRELENEVHKLEQVKAATNAISSFDDAYLSTLKENGAMEDFTLTNVQEIAFFQCAMLDLSIAKIKFEINWFQDFIKNMNEIV
ncbi:MAG: PadR family transcriptional regulator [Longicatena sp.]